MPLNTQFAPISKLAAALLPAIAATGGLYALFRTTWPKAPSWSHEWEAKSRDLYSAYPMQGAPNDPSVLNPFSRYRYQ